MSYNNYDSKYSKTVIPTEETNSGSVLGTKRNGSTNKYEKLWKTATGWYSSRVLTKEEIVNELPDRFKVTMRYNKYHDANDANSAKFVVTVSDIDKRYSEKSNEASDNIVKGLRPNAELSLELIKKIEQIALEGISDIKVTPNADYSLDEAIKRSINFSAGEACYDIINICREILKEEE